MKKKFRLILALSCLFALCAGGAACAEPTIVEEYEGKGYTVSVTYDANGGLFMSRPGGAIMDMFNPSEYQTDTDGVTRIKLIEPTDPSRPTATSDKITLTMQNHFFAGWYQNRSVKLVDGKPVDETGRELKLIDEEAGTYGYANPTEEEKKLTVTPAYEYSGYWDFEKDRVEYTGEKIAITLYAGWVQYFEFNYYYQNGNEWTKLSDTTTFDYKTTNAEGSRYSDKDTIWTPDWQDGAMNHQYTYADSSTYNFPKITGMTFASAYTDKAMTEQIVESYEHPGKLIVDSGADGALLVENRVKDIYIVAAQGEQYKIQTAQQFVKHANVDGHYEMLASEYDFTDLDWPMTFATATFNGSIYGNGSIKMKNITVDYASTNAKVGGLFGELSAKARVENVSFENVTVDYQSAQVLPDAYFGLLAGNVDDNATVTGVQISGKMRIGAMTVRAGREPDINLVASGNISGVTVGELSLIVYGEELMENKYYYTFDPESVVVDSETFNVAITFFVIEKPFDQESYDKY